MRIQPHGGADDVRGLGPSSVQQAHFIHGIEQLSVRGLEPVDLRNGAGDDNRHGIWHEVPLQRIADPLLRQFSSQALHLRVDAVLLIFFILFFCHTDSLFIDSFRSFVQCSFGTGALNARGPAAS